MIAFFIKKTTFNYAEITTQLNKISLHILSYYVWLILMLDISIEHGFVHSTI